MSWKLQALGSNGSGQLGIGHQEDVSTPTDCIFQDPIPISEPVAFSAGGNHTLVLFKDGSLYAAGDGTSGCLGPQPQDNKILTTLTKVNWLYPEDNRIQAVICTWDASVFVTTAGKVYTSGSGAWGELGQGEGVTNLTIPHPIADFPPAGSTVIALAAGMGHVIAHLSNGELWGWGNGRKGQLGEPAQLAWQPRKITELDFEVQRIACTKETTLLIGTEKHKVIGSDKWTLRSSAPQNLGITKFVSANWGTFLVQRHDSSLLHWGRDDHGQRSGVKQQNVKSFICGSEHTLAQLPDGKIIAWGWGEHGNCGEALNARKDTDGYNVLADNQNISPFGAGCATSFLLRYSG